MLFLKTFHDSFHRLRLFMHGDFHLAALVPSKIPFILQWPVKPRRRNLKVIGLFNNIFDIKQVT